MKSDLSIPNNAKQKDSGMNTGPSLPNENVVHIKWITYAL